MEEYDVAVVGAGPAGSSAATVAARAGARVVLLDRAAFPRYKTCGGGLIGPSLRNLPGEPPVRTQITRASFTLRGGTPRARESSVPLVATATRLELDNWLVSAAGAAGAEVRAPCKVLDVEDGDEQATVRTDQGNLRARVVVAADGTSSRLARQVGVQLARVDLGLEVELDIGTHGDEWQDRIHLDWGAIPGSYAWVFPKGDSLTVGVIAARGRPDETRAYLRAFMTAQGLDGERVIHESGHLTRCRTPSSQLGSGGVLLAGDAAGLLEPWTREGISFAVRSGVLAGAAAAAGRDHVQATYAAGLREELLPEMAAGETCLRAFERRPGAFHALLFGTSVGWRHFGRLTRGETTLARATLHPSVRAGIRLLSLGARAPQPAA